MNSQCQHWFLVGARCQTMKGKYTKIEILDVYICCGQHLYLDV